MLRKARVGLCVLRYATHSHRLSRLALISRTSKIENRLGLATSDATTARSAANQRVLLRHFSACTYLWQEKIIAAEEEANSLQKESGKLINPRTGERRKGSNWNYQAELRALAQRLGHDAKALPSLEVALTHSSASKQQENYHRLFVLGRATLQYYIQEYLYFKYPNLSAEGLLDLASFLASTDVCARVANYLGITDLIRCRYPLDQPQHSHIIQRVLFAVEGALYVDVGSQAARKLVHDNVLPQLAGKDLHDIIKLQHPKFMLRAILSSQRQPAATCRLLRESGRLTHFPSFVVGVYSGDRLLAEGCGTSLKRAEKEAVVAALMKHFLVEVSRAPLPSDHEDFVREHAVQFSEEKSEENS